MEPTRSARVMAFVLCGLATLWTATAALAPPLCRPDRNGDGHPLFAAFSQGQAVETPTGNSGAVLMGYTLADMNNDGRPDVVTSLLRNTTATTANTVVAVGLNDGDGRPVVTPGVGTLLPTRITSLAAAEFDHDGFQDVFAVASDPEPANLGAAYLLAGDGTGALTNRARIPLPAQPRWVVAADFDGDGWSDVACYMLFGSVIAPDRSALFILFNNRDGTFTLSPEYSPGVRIGTFTFGTPGPGLDVADLDGDGDLDVIVAGTVIFRNEGNRVFTRGQRLCSNCPSFGIVARDLNGDGIVDVATVDEGGMSVILGLGGGVFAPATPYPVVTNGPLLVAQPTAIDVGDLDGDGDVDVAVSCWTEDPLVIFRNRGDGTFNAGEIFITPTDYAAGVRVADMNGDAWNDLLYFANRDGFVSVYLADARGRVEPPPDSLPYSATPQTLSNSLMSTALADLDGDQKSDVVATTFIVTGGGQQYGIQLWKGEGNGRFTPQPFTPISPQIYQNLIVPPALIGDVNGDGLPDVVTYLSTSQFPDRSNLFVTINQGGGVLAPRPAIPVANQATWGVALGDLDGDGDLDLVLATNDFVSGITPRPWSIQTMLNDGQGNFTPGVRVPLTSQSVPVGQVVLCDLDGDGRLDVVAAGATRLPSGAWFGGVWILRNDGKGALTLTQQLPALAPRSVIATDVDGDTIPEIVVGNLRVATTYLSTPAKRIEVFRQDAAGVYAPAESISDPSLSMFETPFRSAELNGKPGREILNSTGTGGFFILEAGPDGRLRSPVRYATRDLTQVTGIADIDGDGRLDVVMTRIGINADTSTILFHRNIGCRPCLADCDGSGQLNAGDFACFLERFRRTQSTQPSALWRGSLSNCDGSTTPPTLNAADFACFLQRFRQGCP